MLENWLNYKDNNDDNYDVQWAQLNFVCTHVQTYATVEAQSKMALDFSHSPVTQKTVSYFL